MARTDLIAQYEYAPGASIYWRLIRRDYQTGQDHIISAWQKLPNYRTFQREYMRHGAEMIEQAGELIKSL